MRKGREVLGQLGLASGLDEEKPCVVARRFPAERRPFPPVARWRALAYQLLSLSLRRRCLSYPAGSSMKGVAVAVGALQSARTGLVVMSAIAMHNIPEVGL